MVKDIISTFSKAKALKEENIAYLGNVKQSAKLMYSYNKGWATYGIYLAPATLARDEKHPYINVCPFSQQCAEHCLNGAGHNKCSTIHAHENGKKFSQIDSARIAKTHLFYDDREKFMKILIAELEQNKKKAERKGMNFACRLNCTSDLSLERFAINGKNILELYPNVQFYDYTKVPSRLALTEKYPNYHLTFSYDGSAENWKVCEDYLKRGGQVAIVFDLYDENGKQYIPKTWRGYAVEDGNNDDVRFLNGKGVIIGLHYHRVANDYVNGKYQPKETSFIVREI